MCSRVLSSLDNSVSAAKPALKGTPAPSTSPTTTTVSGANVPLPWCLTSTETIRLIRDGEKWGKGVWRRGKREIIYLSLHCHNQNDSCIKMGSDGSHFKRN